MPRTFLTLPATRPARSLRHASPNTVALVFASFCMLQGTEMRRDGCRELRRFCRVARACLSDYLSIGVLAQVYRIAAVREALASCGRKSRCQRALPAEAMVYYVVALGLFRSVSAREVLRRLMEGLRWVSSEAALRLSGKSSISRARGRAWGQRRSRRCALPGWGCWRT